MPRLHQDTCHPETCIPNEQHVSGYIYVDGYMLLVRDTCRLYIGDIITIHLCHGRLVSLCIQQQTGTGDKLATILSPIQETCWRRQVDSLQLVSGNMCPGVITAVRLYLPSHWASPPVQNYTAWWERHMCVNNLPRVVTWSRAAGTRSCDL